MKLMGNSGHFSATRLLSVAAGILLTAASIVAKTEKRDSDGHVLVREWKAYYEAVEKDLPQSQGKILRELAAKAEAGRLSWDFYDAVRKYVQVVKSYDWKRGRTVNDSLKTVVADYDYPVVSWNFTEFPALADVPDVRGLGARKDLRQNRTDQFYKNDRFFVQGDLPEAISDNIANDYEYLLWSMLMRGHVFRTAGDRDSSWNFDTVSGIMEKYYAGRYPEAAYIEYLKAMRIPSDSTDARKAALVSFVGKYSERGIRFLAMQELIRMKFNALEKKHARSDSFLELRQECLDFEKARKAVRDEAALVSSCTWPAALADLMDFKGISASAVENTDTLRIVLRNLPRVEVCLMTEDSTVIFNRKIENPVCSYYVPDTLYMVMPAADDGEYVVSCCEGGAKASFRYRKYTLAMACQRQKDGLAVFLADFKSGKPVEKADIDIYFKDSLFMRLPGTVLYGFTVIDTGSGQDGRYYIACSYTDAGGILRRTEKEYVPAESPSPRFRDGLSCVLLKNMAAFHPGDTLEYKAVLFEEDTLSGTGRTLYRVWTGKEPVYIGLQDASKNTVARDTLFVNEFGSVAGRFALPEDRRNGAFTLYVEAGGRILASDVVTVDEFVLPTFHAAFDEPDRAFFPGDTVTVKGRITSYAGLSPASMRAGYTVSLSGVTVDEGSLDIAADGSFALSFIAGEDNRMYYHVDIDVTDATGESLRFSRYVVVGGCYLNASVVNEADASIVFAGGGSTPDAEADSAGYYSAAALEGDFAVLSFNLMNGGFEPVPGKITYGVYHDGCPVMSGEADAGKKMRIDLSSWPSGVYRLKAVYDSGNGRQTCILDLVKTGDEDNVLAGPFRHFFKVLPSRDIKFQFGACDGPVWASVQLFGDENECLHSEMAYMDGISGAEGSLKTMSYEYRDNWPDAVQLLVTYFRDGRFYMVSHNFERPQSDLVLPVSYSFFTDKSRPGSECIYEIRTLPDVECAVTVFDTSTEIFRANPWNRYVPYRSLPFVCVSSSGGRISGGGSSRGYRNGLRRETVPFQLVSKAPEFNASLSGASDRNAVLEDAAVDRSSYGKSSYGSMPAPDIRENFSESLAFYPFLRSDAEGKIRFSFDAGDKLSEYSVSLFAHDRSMANNALSRKMQVSLPVTVSVMPPVYLYSGDSYVLQVSLSNVSESDVDGMLVVETYDGNSYGDNVPSMVMSCPASVPSNSAKGENFTVEVPSDIDTLGIKVVYETSSGASDGLFVTVPVVPPVQILCESHSALLLPGMSRDSLYNVLRSEFVNVSGYGAVVREVSMADMLHEALPDTVALPTSPDAVSAAEACFSAWLASSLGNDRDRNAERLMDELLSFQNAGGGFAWLKGGPSSPIVTAAVLEYLAVLDGKSVPGCAGLPYDAMEKAVKYLDRYWFSAERASLYPGRIDFQQYLYIRSLYAGIPLAPEAAGRKERKDFAKLARKYLLGRETSAPGHIMYKARRAATLLDFILSAEAGNDAFLNSTGLKTGRSAVSSLKGYMVSLKEYAVTHRSGGKYYPNAVLPFRGLLESELYAHSMMCGLLAGYADYAADAEASGIADGIRLWIMLQKETQHWSDDPACMLALDAVSEGSPELLSAEILVLTQQYEKPFDEIKAAGNDISVRCRYFIEDGSDGDAEIPGFREMSGGEALEVGDRIMAVYDIMSAENRSFVRLSAPRHAALRPEKQLSGPYGIQFRPLSGKAVPFFPYSYREVKSDRSIWYIDVLAEEDTRLDETFVVTQAGVFSCPAVEVECLYAPHYRANTDAVPSLRVDLPAR